MVLIYALVAENPADLIDLVQTTNDQPLEVQLRGDAQVQLLVQGVMVGDERSGVGAGRDRHQYRRIHLDEAAAIQETADATDDAAAPHEGVGDLGVCDEVEVALAVTGFDIPQPVPFFGQGPHALGENGQAMGLNGRLAGAGAHHVAVDTEKIPEVKVLQQGVLLTQNILPQHGLHRTRSIAQIEKRRATHHAHGHDAPGHADARGAVGRLVFLGGLE